MARRSYGICYTCIFCFLIVCFGVALRTTLSYVGVNPRFYIQELYVPALNSSHNATKLNSSIFIDLKFKRVMAFVPIRYQDINITLHYAPNTTSSVANGIIPPFDQLKTAHRKLVVEAPGLPWMDAFQKISGGSTVALAVELATKYSMHYCREHGAGCYYTKAKAAVAAAEVRVDGSGHKVSNTPTRLQ